MEKYGGSTSEKLWKILLELQQKRLEDYTKYETKFLETGARWIATLSETE